VLHAGDALAASTYHTIARLLDCYFGRPAKPLYQAGCKALLLELLYHLAVHFRASELLKWEFMRQQERSLQLKELFDHINAHAAEKLSLNSAARLVGLSPVRFMKTFKQVAGMTLVAYLNHVRLANAARLLRETGLSIAEIANATGFSDQSYFDKRFKRAFGRTPKAFRSVPPTVNQ
jgi:transcriptional regulator GlxA family with amidase domain